MGVINGSRETQAMIRGREIRVVRVVRVARVVRVVRMLRVVRVLRGTGHVT